MTLTKSANTKIFKNDDEPTDHGEGERSTVERKVTNNRSERKISLRINVARCVAVVIIILMMFTPIIVLRFPFPWTTEQSVYTGPVCTEELLNYTSQNLSILSLTDVEVTGREKEVVWAVGELDAVNASQECVERLRLWLCVRLFTSQDCTTTSNSSSGDEWLAYYRSTCPEETVQAILETSVYLQDCLDEPANSSGVDDNIECREDFFFDSSSKRCVPECGKWTYTSQRDDRILNGFNIVGTLLGIIFSSFFLVGSGIKHKQMFQFPVVFLVYSAVNVLIHSCVYLSTQVDRVTVICSSKNLLQNLERGGSSFYCQLAGSLFVYGRSQVVFWWFFHMSVLTYGIFRPLKYRMARNLGRLRYLHLGFLVAGVILPLIPTAIYWVVGDYGVDVVRSYSCVPREGLTFENLPTALFGTATLVMLTLIATKIYMLLQRSIKGTRDEYLVEIKVIIIISVSLFAFVILASGDSVVLWGADSIHTDINAFFNCEARGLVPGFDCSRDSFNSSYSVLSSLGVFVRSILPALFMIFLVEFKSVRTCLRGKRKLMSQSPAHLALSQTTINS